MRATSSLAPEILQYALLQSFAKLSPRALIRNPVMLTVMAGAVVTAILTVFPNLVGGYSEAWFNGAVSLLLLVTVLFGNFAESLAEGRGRAQADYLSKIRTAVPARRRISSGGWEVTTSERLQKGDIV